MAGHTALLVYLSSCVQDDHFHLETDVSKLNDVVMIDIDYFKKFNDSYGHEAGDEVLKLVGSLLLNRFRGNDTAYRFGGEEFLVTVEGSDFSTMVKRFEAFCKEIQNTPIVFHNKSLPSITVSIGIATAQNKEIPLKILFLLQIRLYIKQNNWVEIELKFLKLKIYLFKRRLIK